MAADPVADFLPETAPLVSSPLGRAEATFQRRLHPREARRDRRRKPQTGRADALRSVATRHEARRGGAA